MRAVLALESRDEHARGGFLDFELFSERLQRELCTGLDECFDFVQSGFGLLDNTLASGLGLRLDACDVCCLCGDVCFLCHPRESRRLNFCCFLFESVAVIQFCATVKICICRRLGMFDVRIHLDHLENSVHRSFTITEFFDRCICELVVKSHQIIGGDGLKIDRLVDGEDVFGCFRDDGQVVGVDKSGHFKTPSM
ncbi:hypothetical protein RsoM2USA_25 [Ralstonia phage RsoM2USA]|nr:hypothetical protein RsoM2USA_25 [Ralstonia phage RsoM2USA]